MGLTPQLTFVFATKVTILTCPPDRQMQQRGEDAIPDVSAPRTSSVARPSR